MENEIKKNAVFYSEGINKIVEKILDPTIKVVSFDIFDTLLFRPVLTPVDVFRLLENKLDIPNYHNMRVAAEAKARKDNTLYVQDITLDDIYNTYAYMFGTTEEETERIKSEEMKIEYTLLYARKSAQYLYEKAKSAGKEIIIISDMYLSSNFLDKCLKKNGYDAHTHIYVSSETGLLKSSKMMYQFVLSDIRMQNIKSQEILHIGDNKRADVDCAMASGMFAMHLPKSVDVWNQCDKLKQVHSYILQDVMNSNNAMLYGIMANLYFDDPFADFDKNTFFNGDIVLMGYWFAPLMVGFTKWMIENIEKNKIEQLLMVWRDGYLPLQLLQIMRPCFSDRPIEIARIYMGRDLRLPFNALDRNGFFNSFADNPLDEKLTVDYFIKKRLLCTDPDQYNEIMNIFFKHGFLSKNDIIGKFEKYRVFLNELEPYFIMNANSKIKLYRQYILSNIDRNKKTALFDRSPRGKSSRFLQKYFDIDLCCITTEVYDTPKAKLEDLDTPVKAYWEYGKYYINKMGRIWAQLIEITISDRNPGFAGIQENKDGTCSVILDVLPKNEIIINTDKLVEQMQNAITFYTDTFTRIFTEYLPYLVIDRHGIFDFAIEMLENPDKKDAQLITTIHPGRSILAPIDENVFINWYNRKFGAVTEKKKTMWDYIRHTGYVTAEKMGILLPARTLYRNIIGDPLETVISLDKIQKQIDRHINFINTLDCGGINSIFVGGSPREVGKFFNQISHLSTKLRFVFVASGFLKVPTWFDFPCIEGPYMFNFWGFDGQDKKIKVPETIIKEVKSKKYLIDLTRRRVLSGYSESIAMVLAYETERYFSVLIEKMKPKVLMVWNNWGNNSVVPGQIAKRKGIPVISVERGFLEGTIMLSPNGYGEDLINADSDIFNTLPVDMEEIAQAEKVIDFLRNTGLNRYSQPINNTLEILKKSLDRQKPNVLLVGAFDCENPAFPQDDISKELYSPTFETSGAAMRYLSKLSKKNGWNLIYKPHPLMDKIDRSNSGFKIPQNVYYIKDVDINELIDIADVVVCMISGVAYIALTRGKVLVELAYTPLRGKGCCYEADSINSIEPKIKEALKHGFSKTQKDSFKRHIAQINKYYFFDDLSVRSVRYGRPIEEAVAYIENMIVE